MPLEILNIEPIVLAPSALEKIDALTSLKNDANALSINNAQHCAAAEADFAAITARIAHLNNLRKKIKAPILEAGRTIDDLFKAPITFGKEAKQIIQTKILAYQCDVEEENRRAFEIETEKNKQHAERAALKKMDADDYESAQMILDSIDDIDNMVPAPVNLPSTVFVRDNWKWRLVDLKALILAIYNDQAPSRLIQINNTAANQFAKSVKDTLPLPGLIFYNDKSLQRKRGEETHETD